MERRDFIKGTCALCGFTLLGGSLASCGKSNVGPQQPKNVNFTLDLSNSSNAGLNQVGGSVVQSNVIVVHTSNGYIALSDVCTHAGCSVSYSSSSNTFNCPCHGGVYDINGNVVSGPPPSSLPKYKTVLTGAILTVTS